MAAAPVRCALWGQSPMPTTPSAKSARRTPTASAVRPSAHRAKPEPATRDHMVGSLQGNATELGSVWGPWSKFGPPPNVRIHVRFAHRSSLPTLEGESPRSPTWWGFDKWVLVQVPMWFNGPLQNYPPSSVQPEWFLNVISRSASVVALSGRLVRTRLTRCP